MEMKYVSDLQRYFKDNTYSIVYCLQNDALVTSKYPWAPADKHGTRSAPSHSHNRAIHTALGVNDTLGNPLAIKRSE